MSFDHACFISYPHGQYKLMQRFIGGFRAALQSSLEPMVTGDVYSDDRLRPGYLFNNALSHRMCASACWIVVYSPVYQDRPYCRREFAGMELLEKQRQDELGSRLSPEMGFIIPVLLRGAVEELPASIREERHVLDFRSYCAASADISRHKGHTAKVDELAVVISELYPLGEHLQHDCAHFQLPPDPGPTSTSSLPLPTRMAP